MVDDLLHLPMPAAEKVIRTVAVYLGILIVIRVAGKRLMGQMNSQDLVVVLLLSNVVQNAIIGEDNSLVGGLLGAVVLVVVNAGPRPLDPAQPATGLVARRQAHGGRQGRAARPTGARPPGHEPGGAQQRHAGPGRRLAEPGPSRRGRTRRVGHRRAPARGAHATIGDLRRAVDALTARLEAQGGAARTRPLGLDG